MGNVKNSQNQDYRINQAICWQSYYFCTMHSIEFESGKCSDITMVGARLSNKMLEKTGG